MAYAMMGMMMPDMYSSSSSRHAELTTEDLARIKEAREKNAIRRKLNQGLKGWDINGITVIALNKKNAIRKANNIKTLTP